ncbi:MAG: hypothetical protein IKE43_04465 [Coriobacteriales bacterium]|nr:hypothetical protein [Coriobacteriales bacterium]
MGSFVGILGGPVGVLLGASYGALLGGVVDSADAMDTASAIEVLADKLFENEVALVALVEEEEPAFDAALAKFSPTIIRYDVDDVIAEVDRARELEAELSRQAKAQLRAERKVERKEHREEVKSNIKDRFANIKAKFNKDDECGCGCEA